MNSILARIDYLLRDGYSRSNINDTSGFHRKLILGQSAYADLLSTVNVQYAVEYGGVEYTVFCVPFDYQEDFGPDEMKLVFELDG